MIEIKAIVRREKVEEIKKGLSEVGVNGFTHWHVMGHGRQKGILIDGVHYDELPKEFIYLVVSDEKKTEVVTTIIRIAKTQKNGKAGDGRIFVNYINEAYTISQRAL